MHEDDRPPKVQPWWTRDTNELHLLEINKFCETKIYARMGDEGWEYAHVQWRDGTAYMFGLYCNGRNITPPVHPVVEKREFRLNGWRIKKK